jgi:hypothetical protein
MSTDRPRDSARPSILKRLRHRVRHFLDWLAKGQAGGGPCAG